MSRTAAGVARSVEQLVGDTPLLELPLAGMPPDVRFLAKAEMFNPVFSVKDRAVLFMMKSAEATGALPRSGGTVIECSSGSTGISLAAFSAARGHRCIIVMNDNATRERRRILQELGAEIVLVPHQDGLLSAWKVAEELHRSCPGSWLPHQDQNVANVQAHYETTGPEIWQGCAGRVDVFVCGVGTGGTLTGVARYLKERTDVHVVAVEPRSSAVLSGGDAGFHRIPGIGAGYVSDITDLTLVDEVLPITDDDALRTKREIARGAGLLVGVSSGAAAHGSRLVGQRKEWAGTTIVTVFPDSGERYLSLAS
ncbi:MAG: cysteine synthase family protein [Dermatophilaceae bacterium]